MIEFYFKNGDPDKLALVSLSGVSYSYRELESKIYTISTFFCVNKLKKKDLVAVLLRSNLDFIFVYLALNIIGCIVIPVDDELALDKLKNLGSINYIVTDDNTNKDIYSIFGVNKNLKLNLPEDTALIVFTSGTTSAPKGVIITKSNIEYIAKTMLEFIPMGSINVLAILPMSHMYGFSILISSLNSGSTLYFEESFFNTNFELIFSEKFRGQLDGIFLNLKTLDFFLSDKFLMSDVFRNVRFISYASSILPIGALKKICHHNPIVDIYTFYALSEVPRATCFKNPQLLNKDFIPIGNIASCLNMKLDFLDIKTFDKEKYAKISFHGELVAAGYIDLKSGYFIDFNSKFDTGDLVKIHEDGIIQYAGRVQDLLCIKNKFILPLELENLYSNLCCIQVSIFSEISGDIFHFVKTVCNNICDKCCDSLIKIDVFVAERYEISFTRRLVDSFPVNAQGKIVRNLVKML